MSETSVTLFDLAHDVWHESFTWNAASSPIPIASPLDWSVQKRTLRGGLSSGVEVIELNNGRFSLSVLPTRGMGLWKGTYDGCPLGWQSPVQHPVHPALIDPSRRNGIGWLDGFNELLCRCGLSWHGAPEIDDCGTPLTLHGRIANLPAHFLSIRMTEDGELSLTGVVDECSLFGPRLQLKSTLTTHLGSNTMRITDQITNLGGQSTELELLYHVNVGPPFLEAGAQLSAPVSRVIPRDTRASEDISTWSTYREPIAGYQEQCYFLELQGDSQDRTEVLLSNAGGDRGLSLGFSRQQLPYFTLWKNTQAVADGYVTGIEPSTSLPNPRSFERRQGRVLVLPAGGSHSAELEFRVLTDADSLSERRRHIQTLQGDLPPSICPAPLGQFCPD
jgi:hypothetical protein